MTHNDLYDLNISQSIGKAFAEFHALEMPLYEPSWLFEIMKT